MKRLLTILIIVLVSMTVMISCGGSGEAEAEQAATETSADESGSVFEGSEDEVYYMVTMVSGVEYWVGVYEGFKLAAAQLGVDTVYTGTPEYDINKEIAVFNQVLSRDPAGIAVHPMEPDSFIDPIDEAVDGGVPVVTFAADSPNSKRLAYITSDNVKEGYTAADAIAEAIGGSGEVAVVENPGQLNHEIRVRSFIERIEDEYPDIEVVARSATNQDANKAFTAVQTMKQAHPGIRGIFAPEASSGLGAAQAAVESDDDIKVMCVDINQSVLDMISAGEMFGAIQPDVVTQGYLSMLYLYMAKHGLLDTMNGWQDTGKLPVNIPFVDNGLDIVNEENAQYFYTKNYLDSRNTEGVEERASEMEREFLQTEGM